VFPTPLPCDADDEVRLVGERVSRGTGVEQHVADLQGGRVGLLAHRRALDGAVVVRVGLDGERRVGLAVARFA
jgi:hypothetical protein